MWHEVKGEGCKVQQEKGKTCYSSLQEEKRESQLGSSMMHVACLVHIGSFLDIDTCPYIDSHSLHSIQVSLI